MAQKLRCCSRLKHPQIHEKVSRLRQKVVRLKSLPPWSQIYEEAVAYHGPDVCPKQVISFVRHRYTNYDLLCKRVRRLTYGPAAEELILGYKIEANRMIREALKVIKSPSRQESKNG